MRRKPIARSCSCRRSWGISVQRIRRGRWFFVLAAIGLSLYILNIAAGMAAIKLGWKLARLNDVWEFLIVLVTMVFFVAGLLALETERRDGPEPR